MNLKKKLWRLLSVLSTLLLVILPISGCDYSFSAESNTETGTYTTLSETTDSTSDSATEQNKTSKVEIHLRPRKNRLMRLTVILIKMAATLPKKMS